MDDRLNIIYLNPDLKIQDLIESTTKFLKNEITQEEYNKITENINVRSSLSMRDKTALIVRLMLEYGMSEAQNGTELAVCEMYKNMFFHVYLEGYMGMPVIDKEEITYENYDLLEPIFGPWVESFAQRDIALFKEMLNTTTNFHNVHELLEVLSSVNIKALETATQENKDLINTLKDKDEMVKNLKEILAFNNPEINSLIDAVKEEALAEALTK